MGQCTAGLRSLGEVVVTDGDSEGIGRRSLAMIDEPQGRGHWASQREALETQLRP